MRTFAYSLHKVPLVCTLEYSPPQRQTEVDPGYPADCQLIHARVGQEDIYELLCKEDISLIENAYLEHLGEDS